MTDIPDWAGKRACELLNAEAQISEWRWPRDHESPSVVTVAKLVMQHESDPDVRLVANVINAFEGPYWQKNDIALDPAQKARLDRAVSQYKQEKAK